MRHHVAVAIATILAACNRGDGSNAASGASTRDSSGITIIEYPVDALGKASVWRLSQAPLATIGADENDSTVDLSTSMLGTMLPDGSLVVVTANPSEVLMFDAAGVRTGTIGRAGAGPGEYQFVMQMLRFGTDTLFIFDAPSRKGMIFAATSGALLGDMTFPVPSDRPFPPIIRGRMANGTFIQSGEPLIPTPPKGATGFYRLPMPIFAFRQGARAYDTLFATEGGVMYASSVTIGENRMPISRNVVFGPLTVLAVGPNAIWHTRADRYEIERRDTNGAVTRIIRMNLPPRPVSGGDQEKFKGALRDGLERMKGLMPPGLLETELKKVDETVFADHFAAVGQMSVDAGGSLWVTAGSAVTDTTTTWAVYDPEGALQGIVVLPEGQLLSADASRVVVRREDTVTGVVRLEVWGLTRGTGP